MTSRRPVQKSPSRPAILLPVDGSPASGRAIAHAIRYARKLRAAIVALHVVTPFELALYTRARPSIVTPEAFERTAMRIAARILSVVSRRAAHARVPCRTRTVWEAAVADSIVRTARSEGCELIVMATQGRTGLQRILLGSVTQKVLAASGVPVLICR
jgi:nucleotide-binding universal stress UspA family protein